MSKTQTTLTTGAVGRRGTIVLPAATRRRYGLEDGSLFISEERDDGILIRPAVAVPADLQSVRRKIKVGLDQLDRGEGVPSEQVEADECSTFGVCGGRQATDHRYGAGRLMVGCRAYFNRFSGLCRQAGGLTEGALASERPVSRRAWTASRATGWPSFEGRESGQTGRPAASKNAGKPDALPALREGRRFRTPHPAPQQILGNCSPLNISRIRCAPIVLRRSTLAARSSPT